jgi:hypothetical protein
MPLISGCAERAAPLARNLPSAPAFLAPVRVPVLALGEDARKALADHRAALGEANGRLAQARAWYRGVAKNFGASK